MDMMFYYGDYALMKYIKDGDSGGPEGYIWNVKKKEWVEAWEQVSGYVYGFDSAEKYTKEQAKKYMIGHGATEKEAEKALVDA